MQEIDRVRQFTRFYTRRMGLLTTSFAGSGHSVTDLRVLFDIGRGERTAGRIAADLELDQGFLSRLLKRYDANGWLIRKTSANDARQKVLSLSKSGRNILAELENMARDQAATRLGDVPVADVADAMDAVRARLGGLDASRIELRGLRPGDLGWVIARNSEFYSETYGFNHEFDQLLLDVFGAFVRDFDPSRNCSLIAACGNLRIGSIFCGSSDDPEVAKLRVFFVEPWARGLGVGRRLIDGCLAFAREAAGYRRMVLMTHQNQTLAREIYARSGFRLIKATPEQNFGVAVVEETWEATL